MEITPKGSRPLLIILTKASNRTAQYAVAAAALCKLLNDFVDIGPPGTDGGTMGGFRGA